MQNKTESKKFYLKWKNFKFQIQAYIFIYMYACVSIFFIKFFRFKKIEKINKI